MLLSPQQVLKGIVEDVKLLKVRASEVVEDVGDVGAIIATLLSVRQDVLLQLLDFFVHLVGAAAELLETHLHKYLENLFEMQPDEHV